MSNDKKRLVASIIRFINDEVASGSLNGDQCESLQVAKECFETAYGVSSNLHVPTSDLLSLFINATNSEAKQTSSPSNASAPVATEPVSSQQRAEAERLKQVGNEAMAAGRHDEAERSYTAAIELDSSNAVYYANRAAARSKQGNRYGEVVADCESALRIDPTYAKAHYRLGCAHLQATVLDKAVASFERAVELDSTSDVYRSALEEASSRLDSSLNAAAGLGAAASPLGQLGDFASMLNNPALVQTAMQLFQNPEMRQMMTNVAGQLNVQGLGDVLGGGGAGLAGNAGSAGGSMPDMGGLMRMGQQLASAMQQQNPELVDQLRRQFQNNPPDAGPNDRPAP